MRKLLLMVCLLLGTSVGMLAQKENPQKHLYETVNLGYYAKVNSHWTAPKKGEKRVVFMGNSITRGWARMRPQFFEANGYIGRGIGGQGSAQMLLRFQPDVVALQPYAVVINAGTNDVAENAGKYDPAFTMANIRSMVQIAQANGIKVILSSVLPSGQFRWNTSVTDVSKKIDALNRDIKAYADANGIPYVDYNTPLRDKDGAMKEGYSKDGVHPVESTYKIMERIVQPVIQKVLASPSKGSLCIGTYNVRNSNAGDSLAGNAWSRRCQVIAQLVRYNGFDTWGAQEVKHNQLLDLLKLLPEYGYVGVGRDDGRTKGEYSPIFYKKDRFDLLDSGHFWLAEDTSRPNVGWDASMVRICTWVKLEDKNTHLQFWHFNMHTDHIGKVAMLESSKLVLKKIKEMCGNDAVVLTGDFNVDQTSDSYKVLQSSGMVFDSYEKAKVRYALNGTYNAFNPNRKTNSRIDHVFVSSGFTVDKYGILTDTYRYKIGDKDIPADKIVEEDSQARIPSDHFPVRVDVSF